MLSRFIDTIEHRSVVICYSCLSSYALHYWHFFVVAAAAVVHGLA